MASRRDDVPPSAAIEVALAHVPLERPEIEAVRPARRGHVARCVDASGDRYALKAVDTAQPAETDHDLTADRAAALRHEADVLRAIPDATGRLHVASGQDGAVVWLLTRWLDGRPSTSVAQRLRDRGTSDEWRRFARAIVASVAKLHAAGHVHGDLQPAHVVVQEDDTAALLDFELAHRPGDGSVDYRGALVHYVAPEVARAMLERAFPIAYTPAAEVYALGSVLCVLLAGRTSSPTYDPDRDLALDVQLERIAAGERNPVDPAATACAPALAELIERCLTRDPADRPTSEQLLAST